MTHWLLDRWPTPLALAYARQEAVEVFLFSPDAARVRGFSAAFLSPRWEEIHNLPYLTDRSIDAVNLWCYGRYDVMLTDYYTRIVRALK